MCERSSTWYEDERSRILYTCEEKYDGNMVAFVMALEKERDCLMKIVHDVIGCPECIHEEKPADNPICKSCGILGKNWVWRGVTDQKGSGQA